MATVDIRPSTDLRYVEGEGWNLKPYTYSALLNFSQVASATSPWNQGVRTNVQAMPTGEIMCNQPAGVARTPTATDVYQILKVPANCIVQMAVQLVTAQGSTCTALISTDESSPQTLIAAFDLNGTPGAFKMLDAGSYTTLAEFVIGTTAATIKLTADASHAISAAVINVCIVVTPLVPVPPALN